jgi:hypothetical protein
MGLPELQSKGCRHHATVVVNSNPMSLRCSIERPSKRSDKVAGLRRQYGEEVYVTDFQPVRSSEANLMLGPGYSAVRTTA